MLLGPRVSRRHSAIFRRPSFHGNPKESESRCYKDHTGIQLTLSSPPEGQGYHQGRALEGCLPAGPGGLNPQNQLTLSNGGEALRHGGSGTQPSEKAEQDRRGTMLIFTSMRKGRNLRKGLGTSGVDGRAHGSQPHSPSSTYRGPGLSPRS